MSGISPITISPLLGRPLQAQYFYNQFQYTYGWSIRKLHPAATYGIDVRRSSDDAVLSVGFVYDSDVSQFVIDTDAILTFVGAGDGFVTKVYHQGGLNHLIQTNPALQPQIVSSGALVVTDFGQVGAAISASQGWVLTTEIDTNNNYSFFGVTQRTGTVSIALSAGVDVVPYTTIKYLDDKYYTFGELGFASSNSADVNVDEPVILSCIINNSIQKQYKNGTEIPSSFTASVSNNTLKGTNAENNGVGIWQEFIYFDSDQSANHTAIYNNINFFFDIVQSGYTFSVEELTADAGIPGLEDSTVFFEISPTEVGMVGGFGDFPLTNNVSDKFYTTSDFVTWNDELNPIPVGPCSHLVAKLREDGLIWFFGRSQTLPGPIIKFFVCTLDPSDKTWNVISSDVVGNESYQQTGCFHKNDMYGSFLHLGIWVLRKSSDGLTWTDVCALPNFTVDSSMWSDGTRIRFGGGGVDIGSRPANEVITGIYESLDDGETFTQINILPASMRSVWPNYNLFNGYEIMKVGTWTPDQDTDSQFYFRIFGTESWTLAKNQNRKFGQYFTYAGHAGAPLERNGSMYYGFLAGTAIYKVTLNT